MEEAGRLGGKGFGAGWKRLAGWMVEADRLGGKPKSVQRKIETVGLKRIACWAEKALRLGGGGWWAGWGKLA